MQSDIADPWEFVCSTMELASSDKGTHCSEQLRPNNLQILFTKESNWRPVP
jgi:hypothetical protein